MHARCANVCAAIAALAGVAICTAAHAVDSKQVYARFARPTVDDAVAPLWVWNDQITEQQIRDTLRDLADQKVLQVFVHPRPGMITTYLTDEWFKLWKVALDEGAKLGMKLWIYDENSYPSGFAGGHVFQEMPESRGQGLSIREVEQPPKPDNDLVGAYQPEGDGFKDITADAKAGKDFPKAKYLVASVVYAQPSGWTADRPYVNLLYPGVTEKFLEVTLEPYRKHFGDEFGKRIPGSFTDEPEIRPADGLPWTPDLPEVFQKRWGYNLTEHLPCLIRETGEFKKVRHDYLAVLNQLFIERWAKPYHDYCEKNNLEFTGHYWEHEWPRCLIVPDNMAMYAWHQRPSIDNLTLNWSDGLHAQVGATRTVRELASVANQMGRERTLCEAYGAGGWECRFEDMKRIGDWLYATGVNTLDPHLSYVSIRGARKFDHPQSFSYHAPWFEAYHISAEYFARLSAALAAGRQINDVLLIEPTSTVWMYNGEPAGAQMDKVAEAFEGLIRDWEQNQVEYDIGCEDIIARNGSIDGKDFVVGKCRYRVVVIPPLTETLNAKTVELLAKYAENGGRIFCCDKAPTLIDARNMLPAHNPGETPLAMTAVTRHASCFVFPTADISKAVMDRQAATGLTIKPAPAAGGRLFHMRRVLDDGELIFLVNSDLEKRAIGTISSIRSGRIEQWNPQTGQNEPYPAQRIGQAVEASFDLPPCGSLLLFLQLGKGELAAAPKQPRTEKIAADSKLEISRLDPNVLTLDYADVTCAGETKKGTNAAKAANWIYVKHGLRGNPWNVAVQFKDEIVTKTFPADSGFEATYRFVIDEKVPTSIFAVVERPDLYTITCNDQVVTAVPDAWWLDKSFGKIDIAKAAKLGENTLTIKASPLTVFHELQAAYIIGEFGLRAADQGFAIVPEQPLHLGPWNEQGCRMYSHRVSYKQKLNVADKHGIYRVELPAWYGSVAKVIVNGKEAGYIGWQPFECDVTNQIVAGANEVEVIVFGTLRNTLGPNHYEGRGLIGPGSFYHSPDNGPPAGKNYISIGYGLFEPFVLKSVTQ